MWRGLRKESGKSYLMFKTGYLDILCKFYQCLYLKSDIITFQKITSIIIDLHFIS